VEAGILTEERAEELVMHFLLKCFESYVAAGVKNAGSHPSIMLGGLDAAGKDSTNPITLMCLRYTERFGTPGPKMSVRINEQTPNEVFEIAHRMLLKGLNQPDFYSDRNILAAYCRMGVPMEDAVTYGQSVCEELSLGGLSEDCTDSGVHCYLHHYLMKAMRRVAKGEDAPTFEDFQKMMDDELRASIRKTVQAHITQTALLGKVMCQPLHSAGIVGCLESGKDIYRGGAKYNNTGSYIAGMGVATDSLYAIRRLVYDEKRLTMAEFYDILQKNYEGHELLRQEILNKFPKYGNDVDEVDCYAVHLFDVFREEIKKHENSRGGRVKVGAWASGHGSYPATPDGRRCNDPIATNISPTPGRDVKGATAIVRSATKLDLSDVTAGGMIDISMSPSVLRGEGGVMILRQLVNTYADLGGVGVQFNVADTEVLMCLR
jgi:formate C-acetyltransferase